MISLLLREMPLPAHVLRVCPETHCACTCPMRHARCFQWLLLRYGRKYYHYTPWPLSLSLLSNPPLCPPFPGPRTRGGVIPSACVMCVSACVFACARLACVCLCACVCVRASFFWCVCVLVCLRALVPARVCVRVCVRMRVRMPCVCLHARMRVCVYVHACV